jgi:thymidine phosphorylase
MVAAQGGDLEAPRPLAPAREVAAESPGYVTRVDAEGLGLAVIELGGGRKRQGDRIDPAVGLEMLVGIGERVERGQPLLRIFGALEPAAAMAIGRLVEVGDARIAPPPLVHGRGA